MSKSFDNCFILLEVISACTKERGERKATHMEKTEKKNKKKQKKLVRQGKW